MKRVITEITKREVNVSPCVKCGCDDIEIYNCGYSSFNCAGGKCKNPKCGHKVETGAYWNVEDSVLIAAWNKRNDPDVLIRELENKKENIDKEISRLKTIKNKQ
jgi:hypothetical protein